MNQERLVDEVMRRAGFQQPAMASLAIDATLEVMGQRLGATEARALVAELPTTSGQAVARGPHGGCFDRDELYRRVSRREGVRIGFAVEHVQVVCQVLAEALGVDGGARLRRSLPPDIAELVMPRAPTPAPPPRPRRPTRTTGHTIATGRTGAGAR
jgi:uncharacterized protein (DUF2267 family)